MLTRIARPACFVLGLMLSSCTAPQDVRPVAHDDGIVKVRSAYALDETVARLGTHRVAVLVPRDERLGRRVRVLRTLLDGVGTGHGPGAGPVRVWIEGLPSSDAGVGMLLDELARS